METKCLSPDCQNIHERVKTLEVKQAIYDKTQEEILYTLKDIREFILNSKEKEGRDEQKFKNICSRVSELEKNQKWLVSGIISSLMAAFWHFFKKYL